MTAPTLAMLAAADSAVPARTGVRLRVAIVYPFFAHYRQPVLQELLAHGQYDYVLAADDRDPSGTIPLIDLAGCTSFIRCPLRPLRGGLAWQSGVIRLALRRDIDCFVFLGNAAFLATWIAAAICRLRRRRVLFWTHGWLRREKGLKGLFRSTFYRLAHGLLLYGHRAREIGIEQGFADSTLHVIYNSLDVPAQQELRRRLDSADTVRTRQELFGDTQTSVIIAVGRLTAAKRFDLLIDAVNRLAQAGHRVNLLLVGAGPAERELRELAARSLARIVFYGPCYDEAVLARLIASATVTVSPGNVGLTCMHSFGYGVPVITHDDADEQMPEWEAIVPGVTGDVFRRNSAEDLARVIRQWTKSAFVAESTRERCLQTVTDRYHPRTQRLLIERAVSSHSRA